MTDTDWDDPDIVAAWLGEQEASVAAYLEAQRIPVVRETLEPHWFLPSVASVWFADTQLADPRSVWVISGDLPTDYIPGAWAPSDREAVRVFAQRWLKQAALMTQGLTDQNTVIGSPEQWPALATMLRSRASFLLSLAEDAEQWASLIPPEA